jgi:hypothetical protein
VIEEQCTVLNHVCGSLLFTAPPRVVDLSIRGELVEGSTVTVHTFYVGGGEEGLSRIQWFKSRSPSTGGGDLVEIGHVQTRRVGSRSTTFVNNYSGYCVQKFEGCSSKVPSKTQILLGGVIWWRLCLSHQITDTPGRESNLVDDSASVVRSRFGCICSVVT